MPPSPDVPFYLDWSFWAVIVATIAIFLSQLPPIYLWFRPAQLDIELYSRVHITHKIGNPNFQLHLIINNIGGRAVRVKNIRVKITLDGKEIANLPAQTYLENPNDKNSILFTSFSLSPQDEWAHIINCLNYFSRIDEKKYRAAESALMENIVEKRKLLEDENTLVEASDEFITPFINMFDEKFIWFPGEYKIMVSIITSVDSANIEKEYRFTLFESDSNDLTKAKNDYKYGDGIHWDSGNHNGVIVPISEA